MTRRRNGRWQVPIGLIIGSVALGVLIAHPHRAQGTGCAVNTYISQLTAEGKALDRAAFYKFADALVVMTKKEVASSLSDTYSMRFDSSVADSTCIWFVQMSGSVGQRTVDGHTEGSAVYTRMDIFLDAIDGHRLATSFYPPNFTPEPTPTEGASQTPGPTPTFDLTPAPTSTP